MNSVHTLAVGVDRAIDDLLRAVDALDSAALAEYRSLPANRGARRHRLSTVRQTVIRTIERRIEGARAPSLVNVLGDN